MLICAGITSHNSLLLCVKPYFVARGGRLGQWLAVLPQQECSEYEPTAGRPVCVEFFSGLSICVTYRDVLLATFKVELK